MIKKIIYISCLFIWGCDSLEEQAESLDGEFYIQDGWMAFSSQQYIEADLIFSTAIENNEKRSKFHLLSSIGKGWSYLYNARTKSDISQVTSLLIQSGASYDIALDIKNEIDSSLFIKEDEMNLFAGLTIQRATYAKQISLNQTNWESINSELSEQIDSLYRESNYFSSLVDKNYIFKYDQSRNYKDILLIKIENHLLLGEIDSAIFYYKDYEFSDCNDDQIDSSTILECLCLSMNDGICPIEDLGE